MTPEGALEALLARLEAEERELSRQRKLLFDRIDLGADGTYTDRYREKEREVSTRRREVHARIDALRAEREALYLRREMPDPEATLAPPHRAILGGTAA